MIHLFARKTTLIRTRDAGEIARGRSALEGAGIWYNAWDTEPMPVGGCGAKMRPADWNKGAAQSAERDAQRIIHNLEVLSADRERAQEVLREAGVQVSATDLEN